ncbi:MAG: PorP/SprF family type IX secretion system membrane protein [Bacteroidales bacterium]|nr:PorP/SprF family type IX secretion system membrane protein [Bacteroidales bacterium]
MILIVAIFPKIGHSQDLHFSQFQNSPLNLNPALAAYTQADFRLVLNNRTQWASVTVPYKTISGSFDFKILNRKKNRDYFGIGVIFNKDEAGDSHYGTMQVGLSGSWIKSLSRKNHHTIALGGQVSYFQRSIDYSQLYFPEQWNGSMSNIGQNHSEIFTVNQYNFIDLAVGAHYLYTPSRKFILNSGISVWHITQPNQNLIDSKDARLNIKTQFYTEAEISTNTPLDIIPAIYFSLQGPYNELVFGGKVYYKFEKTRKRYMAMSTGIYGRNRDALILYAGLDYKSARLAITYDINFSPLKAASQYRGGMEISLKWLIFKNKKQVKVQSIPCPIF